MSSRGIPTAACWFCGAEVPAGRAEVETVIEPRSAADGGPFRTLTCRACRTRCGALRNRSGAWLFYPLEGRTEPTVIDRLVPRTSRAHLDRARRWWLRNAAGVQRFRDAREAPLPSRGTPPPRPSPRAAKRRPRAPRPAPPPVPAGPRAALGVRPDASLDDVRRAWRAAVKRWHPDRIPTRDPVVLLESQRRFQELREAYEALVAELSG